MSPSPHLAGRLRRLYGTVRTRLRSVSAQPAKPLAACPAAEMRCFAEELEPRLLLSGVTPGASLDDGFAVQYVIYDAAGGNSGVSTQGADAIASEFSPLGSSSRVGLTPQQIRAAYGIDSIMVGSLIGDGTGQTIVIVDAYDNPSFVSSSDPNYVNSDLYKFNQYFGLGDFGGPGQPTFTKLDQNGGTSYPAGDQDWGTEIALDVEWTHAIAPKANIVLIEANSAYDTDLMWTAVNTARNLPGASVISMSFGVSEYSDDLSQNSIFLTPAGHAGVTFVAASGDDGSPGLYPAYSPNVLAVGGTTLTLSGNNYVSETAWSGSGGGQSTSELAPTYQDGVQTSTKRQMPDVSFDANPNSGVAVYDSYGEGASTPWVQVGGTSLSAPCWAGLIAIANQIRASQGLSSLDGKSETLPGIYSLQAADFHDITSGGNGGFLAGPGYDLVTGRGSPVANILVPALAATNIPEPLVFYSANMDTDPGWTYQSQSQWAWGHPTGGSGSQGGPDPTSGHTGSNVVGYNLSGGYSKINNTQYVTTQAIDCAGRTGVTLDFWRWLGVDSSNSDHASVQVSSNGSTWTTVFQNPSITTNETAWSYQTYDISAVADNQAAVYIRWGMGRTNRSGNYCGWNIDDVTLSQTAGFSTGPRATDPNISITSSPSGTLGTYKVGDAVTARWNDTSGGDGNTGALAAANPVTVDFSQFGGPAAVAATNSGGFWTASYAILAGPIDSVNRNVSVTVTDLAGNVATTADTTNLSVDNQPPTASIAAVTPDPGTTAVSQIAIVFSEPVGGFDLSDLELTRNGGGNLLTGSQTLDTSDDVTWLLGDLSDMTGTPGMYVLSLTAAGSGIVDDAGNPLAGDDVFSFGNPTGDVNGDGVVDAADYIALKRAFGSSVPSPGESADFNGSGTVDYEDLVALMGNFGQSINMAFSAPQQVAGAASPMSAMTAGTPETVAAATMADPLVMPPTSSYTLQDAAAVLDALAASQPSRLAAAPYSALPTYTGPPTPLAGRAKPLSTFLSPPRSHSKAGQVVADALALAGPWRTNGSASHQSPDEPWMASLTVDLAGKPRKGLLDPIGLDPLAASK